MSFTAKKLCLTLVMTAVLAVPSLATAQSSQSLSGLFACEALANKDEQLACFLTETAKLRTVDAPAAPMPTPKEAPTIPRVPIPATAAPTAPEFAPLPEKKAKATKSRTLAIRSAAPGAKGYLRFTLDNGEVWQQIEPARVRLGRAEPDMLTIKRKSFGSFLGTVNGKRPSFRLRRVE